MVPLNKQENLMIWNFTVIKWIILSWDQQVEVISSLLSTQDNTIWFSNKLK
jgi:hypothetical protein